MKLLVEKQERDKNPSLLCLAVHKFGALPGRTWVGEAEDVDTVCPKTNGKKKYC